MLLNCLGQEQVSSSSKYLFPRLKVEVPTLLWLKSGLQGCVRVLGPL